MNRKTIIKVLLIVVSICFISNVMIAQKTLHYKETTEGETVFRDKDEDVENNGGQQAGVVISCPNNLTLKFKSNRENLVDVYMTKDDGVNFSYYLRFILGRYQGKIYENRELEILSPGYASLIISLDLEASRCRDFFVYDPDSDVGIDCYSQFSQKAIDLFKQGLYIEAKQLYELADTCSNKPRDNTIVQRIAIIDSILEFKNKADNEFDLFNYQEARNYYLKILSYNSDDQYAYNRRIESQERQNQVCNRYITTADSYFKEHEYEEAKRLYEKAIAQNCPRRELANARLQEIAKIELNRRQKKTVFTYEISKNLPFGFSVGGYKDKKAGGYFTLKTNPDFFNMLRKHYEKAERPEIDVSAGGNFRPVKSKYSPIWINIGVGYTLLGAYYYSDDEGEDILYEGGEIPETFNSSPEIYHAISPEIGLLGKIPLGEKAKVGIAVRYTFQYRFALKPDTQDYIRKTMHGFGIGLCF